MLEMWESVFADDSTKDVTLVGADAKEVRAHSLILSKSSDVFKEMLSSDMSEGRTKVIKLSEYSAEELQFALRLLYTGQVDASDWGNVGVSLLLPHPQKKTKKMTKILTKNVNKNSPKVASHVTFDLKFGISVKNYGDP